MRLTAPAPAKVNLCLFLGGTRADRRHELVTLFQSVSLADQVELEVTPGADADRVVCPGVEGDNLAATALAELRAAVERAAGPDPDLIPARAPESANRPVREQAAAGS